MLTSSRATNILLILVLAVGIALVAMLATGARGGPLDPPGPAASTDGVREPGTAISAIPFTISTPGRYYLTRNLTGLVSQNGVTIAADNVTLDLRGFTLLGVSSTGTGVPVSGAHTAITITGGTVRNWFTGIDVQAASYVHISNVTVLDNGTVAGDGSYGVILTNGSTLEDCTVSHNKSNGVLADASTVRACAFDDNGKNGIEVSGNTTLENCDASRNTASGITATRSFVRGCTVAANIGVGIQATGYTFLQNNRASENGSGGFDIELTGDANFASENVVGRIKLGASILFSSNVGVRNGFCSATALTSATFNSRLESEYNVFTGCP